MLDIAKDFNQMTEAQSKVSKMPDSTDQDAIDEDKREREEEKKTKKTHIDLSDAIIGLTMKIVELDIRLEKIDEFILTNTNGDKTLQDLLCRIIDSVDWCKCSK